MNRTGARKPSPWRGRRPALAPALALALATSSCGGGGGASAAGTGPGAASVQVATTSSFAAGCGQAIGNPAATPPEAYTANSAVQPQLAANPANALALVGVWEEDRWDAIGARGIMVATSGDGGGTWSAPAALPFSACATASAAGAGYDRASDPSIAVAQGGALVASALAFSAAGYLQPGGTSAVLVSVSSNGGATWSNAGAAIADTGTSAGGYFNDRDALAADPNSANVYLMWDRIDSAGGTQAAWFAHSGDAGQTWDPAFAAYDPGALSATFNNQPQVLPSGTLVDVFTLATGFGAQLSLISSSAHGASGSWSTSPVSIATMTPVTAFGGTNNPIAGGSPIRDSPYMAQTAVDPASGLLAAVWQESSFSNHVRDGIALVLSADGGQTWSAPLQVNAVPGVAAIDPGVRFDGSGRLAVTYYDFRNYTAGSSVLTTDTWLRRFSVAATSPPGVTALGETHLFGPFDLLHAPAADLSAGQTGNALFLGDQQGLAWNGSAWTALFSASTSQGARVFATRSD